MNFNVNPKIKIIECYSPTNISFIDEAETFTKNYQPLHVKYRNIMYILS